MRVWNKLGLAVDSTNEWMGRLAGLLVVLLMVFGLYDVILRYVFNNPTIWIYVVLKMGLVALAAIGGGYALQRRAFVRVDVLYSRWSTRGQAIADIISFLFIALFCVVALWQSIGYVEYAVRIDQRTANVEAFPMYPVKSLIPLGVFLVLLVVVKKFVLDIKTLIHKGKDQVG